jgi:hypothetical protein
MKSYLPLLSIALFMVSCSTAYKSGQTPDDVYFSPERPTDEYVRVEKDNDRQYDNRRYDDEYYEDRYARMRMRNRLYSILDDDYYSYSPYYRYNHGYNGYYNSYYSPYNYAYYWNAYYNPYGPQIISVSPRNVYNKPRTYNMLVFDKEMNNANPNIPKGYKGSNVRYQDNTENYRSSGTNAGNFLRGMMNSGSNSGSSSSPSYKTGSSSSSSSSSGSSSSGSSSSSSSGNAPVRKF